MSSANLETGKARIKLAEANLDAAKAEAERLRALLEYDKIVAPYDCVVTRRLVNPGDLVQAATSTRTAPLFTCQEIDMVRVFADAPEANAAGIHPGLPAEVRLYGEAPLTVRGTVTRIATALDPATRTMRVEIGPAESRREAAAGHVCAGDATNCAAAHGPAKAMTDHEAGRNVKRRFACRRMLAPYVLVAASGCAEDQSSLPLSHPWVAPATQPAASLKVDASQIRPMYDHRLLAVDLPTVVRSRDGAQYRY